MTIEYVRDAEAMAAKAVEAVSAAARRAVEDHGSFCTAFSGGGTPRHTYELLADAGLDWSKVEVFWVDERHVPADDKDSNERLLRETLLSKVPIRETQIHPMVTAATPAESASNYENLLRSRFGNGGFLDLAIMGIGPDGHTASLFPGIPELREEERWVVPTLSPASVRDRVTLTIPALSRVGQLLFLVEGEGKRNALGKIIARAEPLLPGALVDERAMATRWIVAEDARP